ncbi:MAG: GH25 family lysozyme [Eubacteriales bacterium]|nr:GH25 family lysozyme [Eubacteriales bacterium]
MIRGIDVSENNGTIDWEAVKASGVEFAIIRTGYGSNYESQDDKQAIRNMQECERIGIPYAAYLYSYALSKADALSEAEHMIRMVKDFNPSLGCYYDMEDADGYKARNGVVSEQNGQLLTDMCNVFMERMADAGYETGTYACQYWFDSILLREQIAASKWVANWGPEECPADWADIWQYTSDGNVAGNGSSRMDLNYYMNEGRFHELVTKDVHENGQDTESAIGESPIEDTVKYSVGDNVSYNRIYASSGDWTDGFKPYFTEGVITEVYPGSRHPYLIGEGTGFIDDNCIVDSSGTNPEASATSDRTAIVKAGGSWWQIAQDYLGDGVRMVELAEYNGMTIDTPLYADMEIKLPN